MAVSIDSHEPVHLETAARVTARLVENLSRGSLGSNVILNVNVPDLPYGRLGEFRATRLGHRHKAEPVTPARDPRGRTVYWVGPAGPEQDAGPGTDFHALRNGNVSVTPLQVDLTRHGLLDPLSSWLEGCR
jgi:5'-nucleotidase